MGDPRAVASQATATIRREGTPATRQPRGAQWHPVGASLGSSVVRSAGAIPPVSNLSSAFPRVGPLGDPSQGLGGPCPRPGNPGQVQAFRVLHRRDLCGGEKGGSGVGKTKRGKGTKLMAVADGTGLPVAIHATSASPHEVTLVEDTLARRHTRTRPRRLIGDLAYDSDRLDRRLAQHRIELIAPHRINRVKAATQDGRPLRRYRRRWKIERLFAWLHNFRRIATRHEYYLENYLAFAQLGCILILLRNHF